MRDQRRTFRSREVGGRRTRYQSGSVALGGEPGHRQPNRTYREVRHRIDVIDVEPMPRNTDRDIGLVLVIRGDDLDRLAQHLVVKIFRSKLRGGDRPRPAEIAAAAVVAEYPDADHAIGYPGAVLLR